VCHPPAALAPHGVADSTPPTPPPPKKKLLAPLFAHFAHLSQHTSTSCTSPMGATSSAPADAAGRGGVGAQPPLAAAPSARAGREPLQGPSRSLALTISRVSSAYTTFPHLRGDASAALAELSTGGAGAAPPSGVGVHGAPSAAPSDARSAVGEENDAYAAAHGGLGGGSGGGGGGMGEWGDEDEDEEGQELEAPAPGSAAPALFGERFAPARFIPTRAVLLFLFAVRIPLLGRTWHLRRS
jgi:hypothetical protein